MAINISKLKRGIEHKGKSGGPPGRAPRESRMFKVAPGESRIRVFLFKHDGEDLLDRKVVMQFGLSDKGFPVLSTKETLAQYSKLKNSANPVDRDAAASIRPTNKHILNIVDMGAADKKMLHYSSPVAVYRQIVEWVADPDIGETILGSSGRDIKIKYDPSAPPIGKYKCILVDKEKSPALPKEFDAQAVDLLSPEGIELVGLKDATSLTAEATTSSTPETEETPF